MARTDTPAKPKKKGSVTIPSKRSMNFVHHKSSIRWGQIIPVILLLLVASAVFVKLGILDQLDKKTAAYNELAMKQEQLAQVNAKLSGYDELEKQYGRYSYGWMSDTEVNLVTRMDVLALVEERIAPNAIIDNMAVNNNVLTLNIHDITLEDASAMVKSLEEHELVTRATVYTAVAEEAEEASIFISITLKKEAE